MVAQDGDIPEKELGQETNGLKGRGQAKQVGGVDKQCRHSDKASLDTKLDTDLAPRHQHRHRDLS